MRIRSTKPEFWRSPCVDSWYTSDRLVARGHLPRLVFSGGIGTVKQWRELDRIGDQLHVGHTSYIYHLFDKSGQAIYFGKAQTPSYRFQSHATKKEWWPRVEHLNLYLVSCESHREEMCRGHGSKPGGVVERAALLWERKAISDVRPRHNISDNPEAVR